MQIKRSIILGLVIIAMFCAGCSEKNTGNITPGAKEVVSEGTLNSTEWNNKGVDLFVAGRAEEALGAYDKATGIDPLNVYAWYNKGIAYSYLGRYEEALQAYNKTTEIDPEDANAWHTKAGALNSLGRYEEAIEALDKAIELDPQFAYAWYNKGVVLEALGRYDEAQVCYDKAEELGLYIEDVRYYTLNLEGSEHHTLKILNSPQRS